MPSAKTNPNRRPSRPIPPRTPPARPPQLPAQPPELIDPRWLLKAGAAVIGVGLLCAYLSVCILFYNAQWQFVLHPSRSVPRTPAAAGLSFQPVRFGVDAVGNPQLSGWWIPSDLPSDPTVLMLHSQDGSESDALNAARALHDARLNVLLFDYRGYGQSAGRHPTESDMLADSRSALRYLTQDRHIPESSVILYGAGLGASLATSLCQEHSAIPGVILVSADGDTEERVLADTRSHIVPVRLLFHERFPLADPLHRLRTPKLLVSYTSGPAPEVAQRAADPKLLAELPPGSGPQLLTDAVRRFQDTYIRHLNPDKNHQ